MLSLKIALPRTTKAKAIWDAIRVLNTMVLARVSEDPFSKRVENIKRRINERENPTVVINVRRLLLSIGALGCLGFLERILASLLSEAKAKAGKPSVTKLTQSICVGKNGFGKFKRLAKTTKESSDRLLVKR